MKSRLYRFLLPVGLLLGLSSSASAINLTIWDYSVNSVTGDGDQYYLNANWLDPMSGTFSDARTAAVDPNWTNNANSAVYELAAASLSKGLGTDRNVVIGTGFVFTLQEDVNYKISGSLSGTMTGTKPGVNFSTQIFELPGGPRIHYEWDESRGEGASPYTLKSDGTQNGTNANLSDSALTGTLFANKSYNFASYFQVFGSSTDSVIGSGFAKLELTSTSPVPDGGTTMALIFISLACLACIKRTLLKQAR